MNDEQGMTLALALAEQAFGEGEVPVGCVIFQGTRIVGQGFNQREKGKNALYHAELIAIHEACRTLGGWRLPNCSLYVTLEPCPMCAGAMVNARIERVVFGAFDPKAGACGSVLDLFSQPLNHKPTVQGGVYADRAQILLQSFFKQLRA